MKKFGLAIAGYLHKTDRWLLLLWTAASALAVLFLYGMYRADIIETGKLPGTLEMHIVASCIGLVAALIISLLDYHMLLQLWKLYLPVCVILVGMTFFTSFATIRGDNQAWLVFTLGSREVSMQPSEFLKLSMVTTLAIHIAKIQDDLNRLPNVIALALHGGAYVLLIQLQGDSGSALIFAAIFAAMVFCAGINWRYILAALAALIIATPLLWLKIMSEDQKMRFRILINPELSERYAWQQSQAINAFGFGGLEGSGIFGGKYVNVPEAYNDFIFSYIGQSAGFIGALGVLVLLLAIAFKVLYNSRIAADTEGKMICIGIFAMLVAQCIINVGMCLGMLPVIGVTLPLFSAGGSSVLSLYLGLGLVLSVYCHTGRSLFYDE